MTPSLKRPTRTQSRPGHLQPRLTDPLASFAQSPSVAATVTAAPPAAGKQVVWVTLASLAAVLREQARAPCSSAPDHLVLSSQASWGHGSSRALTATSSTECPSRYVGSSLLRSSSPPLPLLRLPLFQLSFKD